MNYIDWRRSVKKLLNNEGLAFGDLPEWDWKGAYAEGHTPQEAVDEALREVVYMNGGDKDFWDSDPGL